MALTLPSWSRAMRPACCSWGRRLAPGALHNRHPGCVARRSAPEERPASSAPEAAAPSTSQATAQKSGLEKDLDKFTRSTASTFAPRPSTATKNPAQKGTLLYDLFEWQSWIALAVGGLLSFNVIFPSEEPNIARLLGMWSIWMFTIPSLRAKECMPKEKEALNYLFLAVPLINVILPFVWKNFGFIFTADVLALVGFYYYKGVWKEVYGLPFEWLGAEETSSGDSKPPQ